MTSKEEAKRKEDLILGRSAPSSWNNFDQAFIEFLALGSSAGFGWDKLNFLHSSFNGAVFSIFTGICVNSAMFSLLLSSDYQSRTFLLFLPSQQLGRGQNRHIWPHLIKVIFHTTWHHAQHIKLGEEGGRRRCSEWWHLSFQVTVTRDGALLFWRWFNMGLLIGSGELIPCFSLLLCVAFTIFISPHEFSLFYSSSSLTHPTGGEWVSSCVGLGWD